MVSTSQAEAANCPTHATEYPVAQRELAWLFRFVSHFVSVIPVFTTTRASTLCLVWLPRPFAERKGLASVVSKSCTSGM